MGKLDVGEHMHKHGTSYLHQEKIHPNKMVYCDFKNHFNWVIGLGFLAHNCQSLGAFWGQRLACQCPNITSVKNQMQCYDVGGGGTPGFA